MENQKVVQQCPRCSRTYKNLRYCATCKSRYCSDCSVKGKCVDCYVDNSGEKEIKMYEAEKKPMNDRKLTQAVATPLLLLLMILTLIPFVNANPDFISPTPANNSVIGFGTPFSVNVSLSGFNWSSAYFNFSNTLSGRFMDVSSQTNTSLLTLISAPVHMEHGIFLSINTSQANLTINYVLTGGSITNVSVNGFVVGTISAGTSVTFSGIQSHVFKGNNNISFDKTTGGGSTLTVSLSNLTVANSDYVFNNTYSPAVGNYSYSFVVFQGSQRNSSGTRFISVTSNSSPSWSFPVAFPSSPTTYGNITHSFNVTWSDVDNDLNAVVINHDFFGAFSDFPTVFTGGRYTYTIPPLGAGNYSWKQKANDTQKNSNMTDLFDYVVIPSSPTIHLFINGQEGDFGTVIGERLNITGTNPSGQGIIELFVNGTFVSQDSNRVYLNRSFDVNATYPIMLRINDTQNYTSGIVQHTVIVPPFIFKESGIFTNLVCPNDTLPNTLIFIFTGFFLLAIIFVNMITFRLPIFNFIIGLGVMFYAFTMLGCSWALGIIVMVFGLMVMISSILVK